jgi:hypothetical protein
MDYCYFDVFIVLWMILTAIVRSAGELSSATPELFTVSSGQDAATSAAPVSSAETILANTTVRNKFLDNIFEVCIGIVYYGL